MTSFALQYSGMFCYSSLQVQSTGVRSWWTFFKSGLVKVSIFGKIQAGFQASSSVMKKTPEAHKHPKPETELENRQGIKLIPSSNQIQIAKQGVKDSRVIHDIIYK